MNATNVHIQIERSNEIFIQEAQHQSTYKKPYHSNTHSLVHIDDVPHRQQDECDDDDDDDDDDGGGGNYGGTR